MKDELPTIERIVVPLDGSELAEAALPFATALAEASGAHLDLVTVALTDRAPLDTQMDSATRNALRSAEAAVQARHTKVGQTVLAGNPADEIAAHARKTGSDLVIMATHGRSGWRRFVLGSVADRLISVSDVPVMTVRSPEDGSVNAPLKPAEFNRIIVPLDGNAATPASMPYAISLTNLLSVKALLLFADEGGDSESAERQLRAFAGSFVERGVEVDIMIRAGNPGEVISEAAGQGDLVVMTSLSATGVARGTHRGSVADYVVKHAEAPVLIVAPRGFLGSAVE